MSDHVMTGVPTSGLSRRGFVKITGTVGTGLVLGVHLPERLLGQAFAASAATAAPFQPNVFVGIDTDGIVTVSCAFQEMGQGVLTSLPMLVAEELDADWSRVRAVHADGDARFGRQATGGSASVRGSWESLRKAGAAAREMLVRAAADRWGVEPSSCRTESGRVMHGATGQSIDYGELVEEAAALPVPDEPTLKDPADFTLLRTRAPRTDIPAKVDGTAVFGVDVRLPGMLHGTVVHCPHFGGSIGSFDDSAAREVPGVVDVFQVSQGVAVVAENTWAAFQGAEALDVEWEGGSRMSNDEFWARMEELAGSADAAVAKDEGDSASALGGAAQRLSATYTVPFLAHATMEPMNATAHVREDAVELWTPTQAPQAAAITASRLTGIPAEDIVSHVTFLGGGFGRRAEQDFVTDAVECSMKAGRPVQVTWTREEDTRHDYYRPATYNQFEAGLDADGNPVAWTHRIVARSIIERFMGGPPRGGIDFTSIEGAANLPYRVPNMRVDVKAAEFGAPVGWWRSVGSSQNGFVTESFIDELAHAAGVDPVEYRLQLLSDPSAPSSRVGDRRSGGGMGRKAARWTCVGRGGARVVRQLRGRGRRGVPGRRGRTRSQGDGGHRLRCLREPGHDRSPGGERDRIRTDSAALHGEITLEDGGSEGRATSTTTGRSESRRCRRSTSTSSSPVRHPEVSVSPGRLRLRRR